MTSMRWLCAAVIAAFSIGCGTPESNPGSTGGVAGVSPTLIDPGHGRPLPPRGGGPVCAAIGASGSAVSTLAIDGGAALAVDAHDNVFYTRAGGGIVKVSAAGDRVYAFGYGTVMAIDAAGNAYVAGSFTQPLDLGHGTLTPEGNIDVFVAKLSSRGVLLFAEQLGLCGDGVESIAVAADGRIAVSGTSMGTAILDASGKLLEQLPFAGHLAFAPDGNLYVAGSFTGSLALDSGHVLAAGNATDVDAFVAKVDVHGDLVSAIQLGDAALPYSGPGGTFTSPLPQQIEGIAVNAHGEVALLGSFEGEMSLFGQAIGAPLDGPSGGVAATFVATLDATGQLVFAQELGYHYHYNPTGAIALADDGRIAVSTNSMREAQQPNGHPDLLLFAADGAGLPSFELPEAAYGYGLGIAFDACGNLEWAATAHPSVLVPMQPTLRRIAR